MVYKIGGGNGGWKEKKEEKANRVYLALRLIRTSGASLLARGGWDTGSFSLKSPRREGADQTHRARVTYTRTISSQLRVICEEYDQTREEDCRILRITRPLFVLIIARSNTESVGAIKNQQLEISCCIWLLFFFSLKEIHFSSTDLYIIYICCILYDIFLIILKYFFK